jgi:hypothetical protein
MYKINTMIWMVVYIFVADFLFHHIIPITKIIPISSGDIPIHQSVIIYDPMALYIPNTQTNEITLILSILLFRLT